MSELSQDLSDLAGSWIITETVFTLPAAVPALLIAPADPLRWSIIFALGAGAAGGSFVVSTSSGLSTTQGGLAIGGQQGPFEMTYRSHGGLVQQAFFGIAPGGALKMTVITVRAQQ